MLLEGTVSQMKAAEDKLSALMEDNDILRQCLELEDKMQTVKHYVELESEYKAVLAQIEETKG